MTETAQASTSKGTDAPTSGWRFRAGVTIFVLGFAAPLAIPLVVASGLSAAWKTALSGALALGVPEVMMVVAAAVMGREGFAKLKQLFGRVLRKYGPSEQVSRARYRTGLVMFALPLLVGWLGPYLHLHHHLPGFDRHPMFWHIGGDLTFALSFFVLGGEFWDKVRSLFVHGARAVFPSEDGKGGRDEG
jgi:hypothetical protein